MNEQKENFANDFLLNHDFILNNIGNDNRTGFENLITIAERICFYKQSIKRNQFQLGDTENQYKVLRAKINEAKVNDKPKQRKDVLIDIISIALLIYNIEQVNKDIIQIEIPECVKSRVYNEANKEERNLFFGKLRQKMYSFIEENKMLKRDFMKNAGLSPHKQADIFDRKYNFPIEYSDIIKIINYINNY